MKSLCLLLFLAGFVGPASVGMRSFAEESVSEPSPAAKPAEVQTPLMPNTIKQRPTSSYRYAYAYHDCAPWDGPAWRVVLRNKPWPVTEIGLPDGTYPYYGISLWTMSPPRNQWISINSPEATESKGQLTHCPSGRACQAVKGRVKVFKITKTLFQGELRIPIPDMPGHEDILPFKATILPYWSLCG